MRYNNNKTKLNRDKVKKLFPVFFISILAMVFAAGCSKNNNPVNTNGNPSKVQGKVTDNSGFGKTNSTQSSVEGAAVILAQIQADGSLKTVSNASVQSDINGQFTVETDLDGVSNLVVVATKGSSEWRAVVSATVKNGITVYAPPLNDETTVEAKVYASIKASGNTTVTFSDVADFISADVAAQVKGSASAMAQLAASITAEADARLSTFNSTEIGGTQAEWQAIVNARAQAQATLERDLLLATSQSDVDAAFNAYTNSTINAYVNSGLDVSAYAKVFEASSRVFINSASNISASAKFAAEKRVALLKAKIINFVVQAKFTAMGAAQAQMNSVISAAVTLNASINAAATADAIIAAFDTYHTAIVSQLNIVLGVNSSTMTTIESNIAGFKATLKSSVSASASTSAVVNAYMKFYSDVKSTVQSNLSSASQLQIQATAQILILLNAQF